MKQEIIKYKHYLLIITALLMIKMVLVPLFDNIIANQSELRQSLERLYKVQSLISDKELLLEFDKKQTDQMMKAETLVYSQSNEAAFKLAVQADIEKILRQSGCEVEQLAWKGSVEVNEVLKAWQLDTRYKGDAPCLMTVTRNLEQLTPLIRIKSYSYGAKQIRKGKNAKITANLELQMWQQVMEAS